MTGRILLIHILILLTMSAFGQGRLDAYLSLPQEQKTDSVFHWYKINVRDKDSAEAMVILAGLQKRARDHTDNRTEIEAEFLRGQYFANKYRMNERGVAIIKDAIERAKEKGFDQEAAFFMHHLGMLIYSYQFRYGEALEYLLHAHEIYSRLGYNKYKYAPYFLRDIGYVYTHLDNYEQANSFLYLAAAYRFPDTYIELQVLSNIGLNYTELRKYDSAEVYMRRTLAIAERSKDTAWIGIATGAIGDLLMNRGLYDQALPYLEKNYAICSRFTNYGINGNAAMALTSMAEIDIQRQQAGEAIRKLEEANALIQKRVETFDQKRLIRMYRALADAYGLQKNYGLAWQYATRARKLQDSVFSAQSLQQYEHVKEQLATEKHLGEIKLLASERDKEKQRRNFLIAGIVLALAIVGLIFNRKALKAKKDLEIRNRKEQLLQSEKLRTEQELQSAREMLQRYLRNIEEKNQLIEQFHEEAVARNEAAEQDEEQQLEYLNKLSSATLLTDADWTEFKTLFEKVHHNFFVRMRNAFADLSESDLRILALTRLNISNKQMAQMLGISPASVYTARYRLRKKLNLGDEEQIEDVVNKI